MTRKFQVEITDADGEQQIYTFRASDAWTVTSHIASRMASEGDFYGHKPGDTVKMEVAELIPEAHIPGAIVLK